MRPLGPLGIYANVLGRTMKLPAAADEGVRVERDLRVPMRDGVELLADLYSPWGAGPMPTVLVRTPYGRRGAYGLLYGLVYAQRGLQVLVQSVRGTFGSGGEFAPFDEREDGLDTVALDRGSSRGTRAPLGMAGASYLGLVQWAVAGAAGERLAAIVPTVTASQFHGATYGGGLALESLASWHTMVAVQEKQLAGLHMLGRLAKLRGAYDHLPLGELDVEVLGESSPIFREALERTGADDAYWEARDHASEVGNVEASVLVIAGWHDLFAPWQLDDYVALRAGGPRRPAAGRAVDAHVARAVGGEHPRVDPLPARAAARRRAPAARPARARARRRLRTSGATCATGRRRARSEQRLHLHAGGGLDTADAGAVGPRRLSLRPRRSDAGGRWAGPAGAQARGRQPASSSAGPTCSSTRPRRWSPRSRRSGRCAPRCSSARRSSTSTSSCACATSTGSASRATSATRWSGSRRRAERDADGVVRVSFALWPMAHRFRRGHRIRVQVSSGAHPRYARNTGTGEPLVSATTLVAADQEVFHDPERPSAVTLTVL